MFTLFLLIMLVLPVFLTTRLDVQADVTQQLQLSPTPFVHTSNKPVPGDANDDEHVDVFDLSVLASEWGQTGNKLSADFNHDKTVNVFDLSIMASNWGK